MRKDDALHARLGRQCADSFGRQVFLVLVPKPLALLLFGLGLLSAVLLIERDDFLRSAHLGHQVIGLRGELFQRRG